MDVRTFLGHHGIVENPFQAEEARLDAVFHRLMDSDAFHPEFEKVYGQPERPNTAVVFGEKGSGKTALRLLMEKQVHDHNRRNPALKSWVVNYDDLNPIIDGLKRRVGWTKGHFLQSFRLVDHMDGILSIATTELVDALLSEDEPGEMARAAGYMSRRKRLDLALLAGVYDTGISRGDAGRWLRLKAALRLGTFPWMSALKWLSLGLLIAAVLTAGAMFVRGAGGGALAATVAVFGLAAAAAGWHWLRQSLQAAAWARRIAAEVRVVGREHPVASLCRTLEDLPASELAVRPMPAPGEDDSRYQLTERLLAVLGEFGYVSLTVMFDRVDEPSAVNGDPERMRAVVWPMLDNKFLQQDGVGIKLLLPLELSDLIRGESPEFFQRARLDKQSLIDPLTWSGAMLYDLCNRRLKSCLRPDAEPVRLRDLFAEDVADRDLISALEQMHQPRDAFKFLYHLIREHCSDVTEDNPVWNIPRLLLEFVRKEEARRLEQMHRLRAGT